MEVVTNRSRHRDNKLNWDCMLAFDAHTCELASIFSYWKYFVLFNYSQLKIFHDINFRSLVRLRKYFNSENFKIYGMVLGSKHFLTSVAKWCGQEACHECGLSSQLPPPPLPPKKQNKTKLGTSRPVQGWIIV